MVVVSPGIALGSPIGYHRDHLEFHYTAILAFLDSHRFYRMSLLCLLVIFPSIFSVLDRHIAGDACDLPAPQSMTDNGVHNMFYSNVRSGHSLREYHDGEGSILGHVLNFLSHSLEFSHWLSIDIQTDRLASSRRRRPPTITLHLYSGVVGIT